MSSLQAAFQTRKSSGGAAFIPFFTLGDPSLSTTEALVREAATRGADIIELGFPFSDPIADGPVIQASYYRALERGFKLQHAFELAKKLTATPGFTTPLVGMVSQTLVYKRGHTKFFEEARASGFAGLIIPDLPAGYEDGAAEAARARGLDLIFLCAPTTPPERRALITSNASGFIYYMSVAGITGARTALPADLGENVRDLKTRTPLPIGVGFGISQPEQAAAVAQVADGIIVGSALVKELARLVEQGSTDLHLVHEMGRQVEALAKACHGK